MGLRKTWESLAYSLFIFFINSLPVVLRGLKNCGFKNRRDFARYRKFNDPKTFILPFRAISQKIFLVASWITSARKPFWPLEGEGIKIFWVNAIGQTLHWHSHLWIRYARASPAHANRCWRAGRPCTSRNNIAPDACWFLPKSHLGQVWLLQKDAVFAQSSRGLH